MKAALARAVMALAICCMDDSRREWSAAMQAEFDNAVPEGRSLSFAGGCLIAAWRDMLTREQGRYTLTSYALALGVMLPMAALQIGSALFGLPYLFPGQGGLVGAMLLGVEHEVLIRSVYQTAVLPMAALLLILGAGHVWLAHAMLDRRWERVTQIGTLALAATLTLTIFMGVLFLDCSQALLQGAVLSVELATISVVARWHAQLFPAVIAEHPG